MDAIRQQFQGARTSMIGAFAELTTLALRAGVPRDEITRLHGRFFDGNVDAKDAFSVAAFVAELSGWPPRGAGR